MDVFKKNNGQLTNYVSMNVYRSYPLFPYSPLFAGKSQLAYNSNYNNALPCNFHPPEQINNSYISNHRSTSRFLPLPQNLPNPYSYNPNTFRMGYHKRPPPGEASWYKRKESPKHTMHRILNHDSVSPERHSRKDEKYDTQQDERGKIKLNEKPSLRNHTSAQNDSTTVKRFSPQISSTEAATLKNVQSSSIRHPTKKHGINKESKYFSEPSNPKYGSQYPHSDSKERNHSKKNSSDISIEKSKEQISCQNVKRKLKLSEKSHLPHKKSLPLVSDRIVSGGKIEHSNHDDKVCPTAPIDKPKSKIKIKSFKSDSNRRKKIPRIQTLDSSKSNYRNTKIKHGTTPSGGMFGSSSIDKFESERKNISSDGDSTLTKFLSRVETLDSSKTDSWKTKIELCTTNGETVGSASAHKFNGERKSKSSSEDQVHTLKLFKVTSEARLIGINKEKNQNNNANTNKNIPQNIANSSSRTAKLKNNVDHSLPSANNKKSVLADDIRGSIESPNMKSKFHSPGGDTRPPSKTISENEGERKIKGSSEDKIHTLKRFQLASEARLIGKNKANQNNNSNNIKNLAPNKDSSKRTTKLRNNVDHSLPSANHKKSVPADDIRGSIESPNMKSKCSSPGGDSRPPSKTISENRGERKIKGSSEDKIQTLKQFHLDSEAKLIEINQANQNNNSNNIKNLAPNKDSSKRSAKIRNNFDHSLPSANNKKSVLADDIRGSIESPNMKSKCSSPGGDSRPSSRTLSEDEGETGNKGVHLPNNDLDDPKTTIELDNFRDDCFNDHRFDLSRCRINVKSLEWWCFCTECRTQYVINLKPLLKEYIKDSRSSYPTLTFPT